MVDHRPDNRLRKDGAYCRFLRTLRRAVVVAALLVAAVAVGRYILTRQIVDQLQSQVEARLAEHYAPQGLSVTVGYVRLIEGEGIEIRDLSIREASPDSDALEVAHVDQLFVGCPAHSEDLLSEMPPAESLKARGMRIRARRAPDGSISALRLFPLPQFGESPPTATVDDASVEIIDSRNPGRARLVLRDVHIDVTHEPLESPVKMPSTAISESPAPARPPAIPDVAIDPAPGAATQLAVDPQSRPLPARIRARGTFTAEHVRHVSFDCLLDPDLSNWSIEGTANGIEISPDLRQSLPAELAEALQPAGDLRGLADVEFRVASDPGHPDQPRFKIEGVLLDGQSRETPLPIPLTDVKAEFYCDNDQLRIEELTARSSEGTLWLQFSRHGQGPTAAVRLDARLRNWNLEPRLLALLPADVRASVQRFSPTGLIHADLLATFDGRQWNTDVLVQCVDVSLALAEFPYRLTHGSGRIGLKDDVLTVDVQALAAGETVTVKGAMKHPGPQGTGAVDVVLERPIPIDAQLLAAMPDSLREVVGSLSPRGMISFNGHFAKDDPHSDAIRHRVRIGLFDCSVRYEYFPYPIDRIRGTITIEDGTWGFENLHGYNDVGYIRCDGGWTPDATGGELRLRFVATDLPLEDELRDALPESARTMWASVRPRGAVDHVQADVVYRYPDDHCTVDVRAQKWPERQDAPRRSIRLEPVAFPYRLDDVAGSIRFHDGRLEIEDLSARHGDLTLSMVGFCDQTESQWSMQLDRITVDRLRADRDLIAALPKPLAQAVTALNPSGLVNVTGSLKLTGPLVDDDMVSAGWDLSIDMENGSIEGGFPLKQIRGGVRLVGNAKGSSFFTQGELNIDSLIASDIQVTNLRGPIWLEPNRVMLGSWTDPQLSGGGPRPVTAQVFGGTLSGDVNVSLGESPHFAARVTLTDANLAEFAREAAPGLGRVSGRMHAGLSISGTAGEAHTYSGSGSVRLREADIYEVPLMFALLKLLRIRRPDSTAFTSSDIEFRVGGGRVNIDRADLNGDAISLRGRGEIEFDRRVNMDFYTMVGRGDVRVPIITPALGLASRQLLLIHLAGSLDQPDAERKALPGLNDTLQQLFPEAGDAPSPWKIPSPADALRRTGILPRR